jgi:hypothetical protein
MFEGLGLTFDKESASIVAAIIAAFSAVLVVAYNNFVSRKMKRAELLSSLLKDYVKELYDIVYSIEEESIKISREVSKNLQGDALKQHMTSSLMVRLGRYSQFFLVKSYLFDNSKKHKANEFANKIEIFVKDSGNFMLGRTSELIESDFIFSEKDAIQLEKSCRDFVGNQSRDYAEKIRTLIHDI